MFTPISHSTPDEQFLAELGSVIVEWNQTEARVRQFLFLLMGAQDASSFILLAHLGNVNLVDAIKSYKVLRSPELISHIDHFCTYFHRLREHRNYYVHGVMIVTQGVGEIEQITAKGKLAITDDRLTIDDLKKFKRWMLEFATYCHVVQSEFNPQTRPKGLIPLKPQRMPLLPDILTKNRLYPLGEFPPQQPPA